MELQQEDPSAGPGPWSCIDVECEDAAFKVRLEQKFCCPRCGCWRSPILCFLELSFIHCQFHSTVFRTSLAVCLS